ncbi:MAG: hypothetical protein AMXMBFR59_23500 [Rhodanobacteraceae bacterium]
MKKRIRRCLLALVSVPAIAGAVPCQFGCGSVNGCDDQDRAEEALVFPYQLHDLDAAGQRLDLPVSSRPSLLTGGAPHGQNEQYATCDDLNVVVGPGGYGGHLWRAVDAATLSRHRLDVDARGYVGNADPASGARGWWPGLAAWIIPMANGTTAELRVDYSSYRSGYSWTHRGNQLRVVLDGVQQDMVPTASDEFAIELVWGRGQDPALLIADLDAAGRPAAPTWIPLVGVAADGFAPQFIMVGRRGPHEFRWSYGDVRISSELTYVD